MEHRNHKLKKCCSEEVDFLYESGEVGHKYRVKVGWQSCSGSGGRGERKDASFASSTEKEKGSGEQKSVVRGQHAADEEANGMTWWVGKLEAFQGGRASNQIPILYSCSYLHNQSEWESFLALMVSSGVKMGEWKR